MPFKVPHICGCGRRTAPGSLCECHRKRKQDADSRRLPARQRGYTRSWDKARQAFIKDNPSCTRCGKPATVVDHILAHKGNMVLFWNRANWQSLCTVCHNSWKQSLERSP